MAIITPFPQLTFNDLIVRPVQNKDVSNMVDYFCDNKEYLTPWEPIRADSFFSYEGWEKRISQLNELQRYGLSYYFIIEHQHKIQGIISYNNIIQYPFHAATLGYSLAPRAQGKGWMHNALNLTNNWMFDHLNLHRISAAYMPHNQKSAAVLNKLGFAIEGRAKDYLLINGKWQDHILTSLLNPYWQPS